MSKDRSEQVELVRGGNANAAGRPPRQTPAPKEPEVEEELSADFLKWCDPY